MPVSAGSVEAGTGGVWERRTLPWQKGNFMSTSLSDLRTWLHLPCRGADNFLRDGSDEPFAEYSTWLSICSLGHGIAALLKKASNGSPTAYETKQQCSAQELEPLLRCF